MPSRMKSSLELPTTESLTFESLTEGIDTHIYTTMKHIHTTMKIMCTWEKHALLLQQEQREAHLIKIQLCTGHAKVAARNILS